MFHHLSSIDSHGGEELTHLLLTPFPHPPLLAHARGLRCSATTITTTALPSGDIMVVVALLVLPGLLFPPFLLQASKELGHRRQMPVFLLVVMVVNLLGLVRESFCRGEGGVLI